MATTPVFAPDGSVRSIPDDQLNQALQAGGKRAVQMQDPQGTLRYVPEDQVGAAKQAGGQLAQPGFLDSIEQAGERIWQQPSVMGKLSQLGEEVGSGLRGVATGVGKGILSNQAAFDRATGGIGIDTFGPHPSVPADVAQQAQRELQPSTPAEKTGYYGERTGEFFLPAGAVGKASKGANAAIDASSALSHLPWVKPVLKLATRSALEGASTGAIGAAQGQDPLQSAEIGAAAPVAGKLIEGAANLIPAGAIMNRLMKVAPKALRYGADPGGQLAKEGITGSSFGELDQKVGNALQSAGAPITQALSTPQALSKTVDITPAIDAVDEGMKKSIKFKNPELYDRLKTLRHELTFDYGNNPITGKLEPDFSSPVGPDMTPLDANTLKQTVGDKINWGTAVDRAEGQVRKQVYGILNRAVQDEVPEVGPLNERYANLSVAKRAMSRMADLEAAGATPSMTGDILKSVVRGGLGSLFNPELGSVITALSIGDKALKHPGVGSVVASQLPKFLRGNAQAAAIDAKNAYLGSR